MATLKELSEHTGYSITTISRVLNNDPTMSVSDATRAAILEAAGALNYKSLRPGSAAMQPVICALRWQRCSRRSNSSRTPIICI